MSEPENHANEQSTRSRRSFLTGLAAGALGTGAVAAGTLAWQRHRVRSEPVAVESPLMPERPGAGIPGPFPGRVIEAHHAQAATGNQRNIEAVRRMLAEGMRSLVGSDDDTEAWRHFFRKGDRVGIKVVPVGGPDSISSPEVVLEIIAALTRAGVRANDILLFERYEDELRACRYDRLLPDGVHWEAESLHYDDLQVELDGQIPGEPRSKRVSGYDRDVYRTAAFCHPKHDPQDDRRFRSHLSRIITQKIDKFISIPVLKDHLSSGVTLSLKNLSHGSVNNVARSHIEKINPQRQSYHAGDVLNQCNTFIPAVVSLPVLREKAVLQILDGLVATYEGGPKPSNPTFATWNYNSLFMATDPVALDHVGWQIIDDKRAAEGWPPVARMGLEGEHRMVDVKGRQVPSEQLPMRQPDHIALAATLGLGVFDRAQIDHRRLELG